MTSPRAHAAQHSTADATAELKRCAGTQFDPELVDLVCDLAAEPDRLQALTSASAGDPLRSPGG